MRIPWDRILLKKQRHRSGVKDSLLLTVGTASGQAVMLLSTLVTARQYSLENFGTYSMFIACVSVIAIISGLRFDVAISKSDDLDDAYELGLLATFVALLLAPMLSIFAVFLIHIVDRSYLFDSLDMCLFTIGAFFTVVSQAAVFYLTRVRAFKPIAMNRFLQPSISSALAVLLGFLGFFQRGLILGFLLGQVFSAFLLVTSASRLHTGMITFSIPSLWKKCRQYKVFPLYNLPHALIDSLQSNFFVFLVGGGFGQTSLGLYSLANRILKAPVSIIGGAISQVFLGRIANCDREKELSRLSREIFSPLLVIASLLWVGVMVFPNEWYALVFGSRWIGVGEVISALVPLVVFNFVSSPLSQIPFVLGRQKESFLFGLLFNGGYLLTFYVAILMKASFSSALFYSSVSGASILCLYIFWIFTLIKRQAPSDE